MLGPSLCDQRESCCFFVFNSSSLSERGTGILVEVCRILLRHWKPSSGAGLYYAITHARTLAPERDASWLHGHGLPMEKGKTQIPAEALKSNFHLRGLQCSACDPHFNYRYMSFRTLPPPPPTVCHWSTFFRSTGHLVRPMCGYGW